MRSRVLTLTDRVPGPVIASAARQSRQRSSNDRAAADYRDPVVPPQPERPSGAGLNGGPAANTPVFKDLPAFITAWQAALGRYNTRDRQIVSACTGRQGDMTKLATAHGVSKKRIRQIIDRRCCFILRYEQSWDSPITRAVDTLRFWAEAATVLAQPDGRPVSYTWQQARNALLSSRLFKWTTPTRSARPILAPAGIQGLPR